MDLIQSPVDIITQLLELALECLEEGHVLVINRKSQPWRRIMNRNSRTREALFTRSNDIFPSSEYYMIDPIPLFLNAEFSYEPSYPFISNTTNFRLLEGSRYTGDSPHLDDGLYQRWVAGSGCLREIQVAQPRITKIHWYVVRDGHDVNASLYRVFPQVIAIFWFNDGLRMGEFYDLIVGHRGRFSIRWPRIGGGPPLVDRTALGFGQNLGYKWYQERAQIADTEGAILVYQEVERHTYRRRRQGYLYRPDLLRYHHNLHSLLIPKLQAEAPSGPSITFYRSNSGTTSAMMQFLHAAQDPV
ncbi:hypothetical protein F5Y04DRAFT_279714 [Hypomontagnella monticulosa]|nr:hypothetical protein F5Y04DRAFT_279714 [Hypomontagnella monticulosa]